MLKADKSRRIMLRSAEANMVREWIERGYSCGGGKMIAGCRLQGCDAGLWNGDEELTR